MHLTLVIPGLLDMAAPVLDGIDAAAPALTRLLAAAGSPSVEHDGAIAVICAALGIVKQDDWPIAPWLARTQRDRHRCSLLAVRGACNLHGRSRGCAFVGRGWRLESVETTALLSTINAHFAGDGIRFEAPDSALAGWRSCNAVAVGAAA